jgi:Flp pilus assembly protein TadD
MLKRVLAEIIGSRRRPDADPAATPERALERAREALVAGRPRDALLAASAVLDSDASHEGAQELVLSACASAGDYTLGIPVLRAAAGRGSAAAHRLLGTAYRKTRQLDAAAAALEHAVRLRPDDHRGWNELGIAELERGRTRAARASFERALALAPESAQARCNLGIIALDELELDQAIGHLRRAVELEPALIEARCTLGLALYGAGDTAEAERVITTALADSPGSALARFYSAFFLLGRGEWREGWRRFEDRLLATDPPFPFQYPRWNGEPVAAKRVLVCGEQGLGDQIMFASCLPDLLAHDPACTLVVDRRLSKLMKRAFPGVHVIEDESVRAGREAGFDYQVAIGSLPRWFRSDAADFPPRRPYLRADADRVLAWRQRLAALGAGVKIGVSWRGGTLDTRRALRSLELERLLPLNAEGRHFVSLQYGDCAEEIEAARERHGLAIHHWPEAIADYDETAALVSSLDLVVSVCTSVVHLAGALGREAWVLAPASPEWRYGFSGEGMPWYRSVRIFRQPVHGEWSQVIDAVAAKLRDFRPAQNTQAG